MRKRLKKIELFIFLLKIRQF